MSAPLVEGQVTSTCLPRTQIITLTSPRTPSREARFVHGVVCCRNAITYAEWLNRGGKLNDSFVPDEARYPVIAVTSSFSMDILEWMYQYHPNGTQT